MHELEDSANTKAFSSFRVLNGDGNVVERDHLFRNMAQLFSYVSDRCDDDQVAQYDDVLCQLADLVEVEARAQVARTLAPLERAPGAVVVRLANDEEIEVAGPLLEFSSVLSDDDLIEVAAHRGEAHRVAIAGRPRVAERVGEAIVDHGGQESVTRLVRNSNAELGRSTLAKLVERAVEDDGIAEDLRGRVDVDWTGLRSNISAAGEAVLENLALLARRAQDPATMGKVNAVVYNRMRSRAGFKSEEWRLAWNQVKALSDRRQLDEPALARFARFGYGHHTAAALTVMLGIGQDVLLKWLAGQDYVAVTVACRAMGIDAELFARAIAVLPWRDLPSREDIEQVRVRFEAIGVEEAEDIFDLWRAHAFRRRATAEAGAA